jgi:hypothetical protein
MEREFGEIERGTGTALYTTKTLYRTDVQLSRGNLFNLHKNGVIFLRHGGTAPQTRQTKEHAI